jgi:D-alanine-D-alanine ligase
VSRVTVAVIGGGASSEHDISLASARGIAAALDRSRYEVVELTIRRDGSWATTGAAPLSGDLADAVRILEHADVVIPALHGPHGEDGTIAALLELVGVPYVGSDVFAGAVAMDKWATKVLAASAGVAVAPGVRVTTSDDPVLDSVPLPAVVKPNRAGSSHGVALVGSTGQRQRAVLRRAVMNALAFDASVLVEAVITGREVDVAVLEHSDGSLTCAPPLEIVLPQGGVFDTAGKYDAEPDFRVPARVNTATVAALEDAARTMFRALGCRGVARVDFFVLAPVVDDPAEASTLVLNEVNTFPGFTPHSQVPRMFAAAGVSYSGLLDDLIETALASGRGSRIRRR